MKKITFFVVLVVLISAVSYILYSSQTISVATQPNRQIYSSLIKSDLPDDFIPITMHITAIGDSLTKGVGDTTNQGGYLKYLQDDLLTLKGIKNVEVANLGVKGQRSNQLLDRIKEENVQNSIQEADLVLITIGGNDVMKIISDNLTNLQMNVFEEELNRYKNRLQSILSEIRATNSSATILLIGLYNPFSEWFGEIDEFQSILEDWNQASQEIVNRYDNTVFVDISTIFTELDENLLYDDHFHPNNKGYELIAKEVFSTLKDYEILNGNGLEEEVPNE